MLSDLIFKSASDSSFVLAPSEAYALGVIFLALSGHISHDLVELFIGFCINSVPGRGYDGVLYLLPNDLKLIGLGGLGVGGSERYLVICGVHIFLRVVAACAFSPVVLDLEVGISAAAYPVVAVVGLTVGIGVGSVS